MEQLLSWHRSIAEANDPRVVRLVTTIGRYPVGAARRALGGRAVPTPISKRIY